MKTLAIACAFIAVASIPISSLGQTQIVLSSSNVIGGSGSWAPDHTAAQPWNGTAVLSGAYNAFGVVNNQTGAAVTEVLGSYWLAPEAVNNAYFVLDLGAPYLISQISLFNTHNGISSDRSTAAFDISASNVRSTFDATTGYSLVSAATVLSSSLTLPSDPISAVDFTSSNGLNISSTAYQYLEFTAVGPAVSEFVTSR